MASGVYDASEAYILAARKRASMSRITFLLFVILPTLLAIAFYGFIASPRYVSEAQFIVRSVSSQKASGLEMLFRTFGLARTVDDSYAIQKYLQSRDAVRALEERGLSIAAIYGTSNADFLSRFPRFWRDQSFESRYDYFLDRVTIVEDNVRGISILRVVSFDPQSAQKINQTLMALAEEMVNRMNHRAQRDIVEVSVNEVRAAEGRIIDVQADLTTFRNRELLIDPSKSSLGIIETIATLNADIAYSSAQLKELRTNSPVSPAIAPLVARINSLEERVKVEQSKLTGSANSLSEKMAVYEQMTLKRDLAEKSLAAAIKSLDVARQDARRQHIYIEPIVASNLPDQATEPRRVRGIFTVLILGFSVFAVLWILSVGAREHKQ
ncbi:MAG: hypothetical protein O9322_04190 [Beijerinckiaceae bacterium]|nr:hypothetical protein [Beijerinckiaceae bacterium]MCZ8298719.1 hypothetical protein [Beijerinckiaceae bacterium]